jgi:putative flavoprotein involved in K+ transport
VDCNPLLLEEQGARLCGHLRSLSSRHATFAGDLEQTLASGVEFERQLRQRIDDYVRASGTDAPKPPPPSARPCRTASAPTEVDLRGEGVSTILWANGFRPAFNWIDLPIFDELGFPRATRGITDIPGLAFIGLPWLYRRRSPLLLGVGDDAEHIAGKIASRVTAKA